MFGGKCRHVILYAAAHPLVLLNGQSKVWKQWRQKNKHDG